MANLMTQKQLGQLCEYLEGPEGCHFVDAPDEPEGIHWDCDGTLRLTRKWLKRHQLAVEGNIEALQACGGYCDCEVVLNATNQWANYLREHHDSESSTA